MSSYESIRQGNDGGCDVEYKTMTTATTSWENYLETASIHRNVVGGNLKHYIRLYILKRIVAKAGYPCWTGLRGNPKASYFAHSPVLTEYLT